MNNELKRLQIEKATIADDEQPMKLKTVLQSGHLGDLIYCLSAVQAIGEPVHFYVGFKLSNGVPNHPSGRYCMNNDMYAYIKPLLKAQPYISEVSIHDSRIVDYNFDQFRNIGLNLACGDLRRSHFQVYPELATDLTQTALFVEQTFPQFNDFIVINFSSRYRNRHMNYSFLQNYNVIFVGLDQEYDEFVARNHWQPKRMLIDDALQMAMLVKSCKLYIGNQSSTYAIAEQLKVPRLLESYQPCPNVIPMGANGYDYTNQSTLEYFVKKLIN